jgi:hypothetical protein
VGAKKYFFGALKNSDAQKSLRFLQDEFRRSVAKTATFTTSFSFRQRSVNIFDFPEKTTTLHPRLVQNRLVRTTSSTSSFSALAVVETLHPRRRHLPIAMLLLEIWTTLSRVLPSLHSSREKSKRELRRDVVETTT